MESPLPRAAQAAFEQACQVSPVVILLGARQTGKTTLIRSLPSLANHSYLTLDDLDLRAQAEEDPDNVLERAPRLILDEVQRAPELLLALKRAVDSSTRRTPGRFVLTGSANLLMMQRISETLAGRAAYVTLWPFTRREQAGLGKTGIWSELLAAPSRRWREVLDKYDGVQDDWRALARTGGLPVPAHELKTQTDRAVWFGGYVQTYLERDLQDLRAVQDLADFRRLMRAACLRIGGLVNQAEIGRDVGMSQPQVHRYLNLLETGYQAVRLPAFGVNRTLRLIKSPKLYWSDTGLAMYLAGESEPRGAHFENLVLCDLLAWRDLESPRPEVLYWRTASGLEVDFVIEARKRLLPIEVKSAGRVDSGDGHALHAFVEEYPDLADGGLLLHAGDQTMQLTKHVLAVPWWRVF